MSRDAAAVGELVLRTRPPASRSRFRFPNTAKTYCAKERFRNRSSLFVVVFFRF